MNKKKTGRSSKSKSQMDFSNVTAKIDNKAPRLNPENYLKSLNILADSIRLKRVDNENLELIKRLNLINRLGGKVDCSTPITNKSYKSKLEAEIRDNNRMVMRDNKKLLKEITSTQAAYPTAEFLRDWKRIEENMERTARYPLIWKSQGKLDTNKRGLIPDDPVPRGAKVSLKKRARCFFDIEIVESKENLGRIVFELYNDFTPITCSNFIALCRGSKNGLSYKGTQFHRILPNYWCQGGDVTKFNGTGGASIYGDKFADENFTLRHAGPGVISMWNDGKDRNDSKFNITFKSLSTMNGKRVVFGKVVRGLSNLYKIEELGCSSGKPIKTVVVSKCGILKPGIE